MTFVTHQNGLREGVLPDGKPAFRDRMTSFRDRDGRTRPVIERTRYARWSRGRAEYEARPIVRRYDVVHIHGAPAAQYRPSRFADDEYRGFRSRFAVPVILATAAAVAFASQRDRYDDPVDLMGDMQISSGFEDGYAYSYPSEGMDWYDPREGPAEGKRVSTARVGASESRSGQSQSAAIDPGEASRRVQQSVGSAVPVQIPDDVRAQVRKQVRLSVAMHQNGHPLVLGDVLASGYARIYLFQTAQPLDVAFASGEGGCFLNTGDLIRLDALPAAESTEAPMTVVASGANSCQPGEVVRVRLTDLQEMLNGFSERVEDNMKRVSTCAASGRC